MQKIKTLKLWDQLQADTETMWDALQSYPEVELQARPAEGGWSVAQIMQHLHLAERSSWQSVQKRLKRGSSLRKGRGHHWRRAVKLTIFMRLPMRYRAPEVVGSGAIEEALEVFAGTAELMEHWLGFRQNTGEELRNLDEKYFDAAIYRHPAMGYLTLPGMLRFFYEHQRRHFRQIRRLLRQ